VRFKDYYQTLGVAKDATEDQIKKAFRKLARQFHPDVAKDKKGAEEKFKEVNEAYEVLGDPEKRKKYDHLGPDWQQQPGGVPGGAGRPGGGFRGGVSPGGGEFNFEGTGFSDFFESMFGGARRQRGGGFSWGEEEGDGYERSRAGQDLETDLLVTLDEVIHGSTRSLTVQRRDTASGTETYQVKIPPGIREGQRIRLTGKGQIGRGGGAAGDLYLRIRLARHPDFRVEEGNLYYELELKPWDAVLGASVMVPTLDGRVSLRIAPGTQNQQRLRLRGLGLPDREKKRGDLFVEVRIEVPETVTDSEKELWEKLKASAPGA
jgi:curved DNA-binding protein